MADDRNTCAAPGWHGEELQHGRAGSFLRQGRTYLRLQPSRCTFKGALKVGCRDSKQKGMSSMR